jgi:hypothetical protein
MDSASTTLFDTICGWIGLGFATELIYTDPATISNHRYLARITFEAVYLAQSFSLGFAGMVHTLGNTVIASGA